MAHRHCHAGGYWDNKSDYAACIDAFNRMDESTPSPPEIDNDVIIIAFALVCRGLVGEDVCLRNFERLKRPMLLFLKRAK